MQFEEHKSFMDARKAERIAAGLDPLPLLNVSFSGGRTSAVMTKRIWDEWRDQYDIYITFANTGCEHIATLDFVHECETRFGWPVVWIEALVSEEAGMGVRHKVVNYEAASRNGQPFHDVIRKYGIFNQSNKACTDRTKLGPMNSFLKDNGFSWGKALSHKAAIGIRYDEIDRVSMWAVEKYGAIYPMVDWKMTKRDVGLEIRKWGFDLRIPGDHFGNCTWCWKKTLRKHLTLAKQAPEVFDFPRRMEQLYGGMHPDRAGTDENGRNWFFRKHMSADDIIRMAKEIKFRPYRDDAYAHGFDQEMDRGGGCGESCEVFADRDDNEPWLFPEFAP